MEKLFLREVEDTSSSIYTEIIDKIRKERQEGRIPERVKVTDDMLNSLKEKMVVAEKETLMEGTQKWKVNGINVVVDDDIDEPEVKSVERSLGGY